MFYEVHHSNSCSQFQRTTGKHPVATWQGCKFGSFACEKIFHFEFILAYCVYAITSTFISRSGLFFFRLANPFRCMQCPKSFRRESFQKFVMSKFFFQVMYSQKSSPSTYRRETFQMCAMSKVFQFVGQSQKTSPNTYRSKTF